jgi:hypothetical protein
MDRFSGWAVRTSWLVALLLLVSAPRDAAAQYMPPVLDPKTYRSPSGGFELTVDPGEIYGSGAAKYQIKENGKARWSGTLPFTMCEAAVTNAGVMIGYAYTHSPGGFPKRPGDYDPGKFVVAILGPDGEVRLQESVNVAESRYLHGRPTPIALGFVLDEPNDRAIVRIAALEWGQSEVWWDYRLLHGDRNRQAGHDRAF